MAVRNNAERMAMNTPVQGTAADIMKVAMINMATGLDRKVSRLILQVHDELVLEVKDDYAKELETQLRTTMSAAAKLSVTLDVSSGIAKSWIDL